MDPRPSLIQTGGSGDGGPPAFVLTTEGGPKFRESVHRNHLIYLGRITGSRATARYPLTNDTADISCTPRGACARQTAPLMDYFPPDDSYPAIVICRRDDSVGEWRARRAEDG